MGVRDTDPSSAAGGGASRDINQNDAVQQQHQQQHPAQVAVVAPAPPPPPPPQPPPVAGPAPAAYAQDIVNNNNNINIDSVRQPSAGSAGAQQQPHHNFIHMNNNHLYLNPIHDHYQYLVINTLFDSGGSGAESDTNTASTLTVGTSPHHTNTTSSTAGTATWPATPLSLAGTTRCGHADLDSDLDGISDTTSTYHSPARLLLPLLPQSLLQRKGSAESGASVGGSHKKHRLKHRSKRTLEMEAAAVALAGSGATDGDAQQIQVKPNGELRQQPPSLTQQQKPAPVEQPRKKTSGAISASARMRAAAGRGGGAGGAGGRGGGGEDPMMSRPRRIGSNKKKELKSPPPQGPDVHFT